MLKLNSVLLMVILCGGLQMSSGEKLKCEFKDEGYNIVGLQYTCKVTSLDNSFNNIIIDGYTGVHKTSKNEKYVKAIWIDGGNTKYIPEGLGSFFNLLALLIDSSQLIEIRSKDFQGMQNLEYLSLFNNKLTSVPSDAFSSLPKLKYLRLYKNQIQQISSELFSNNLNLEDVDFDNNRIKYIGSVVFNKLRNLNKVEFGGNICLQKDYIGIDGIIQMKKDIVTNCKNPATTTTTTTTTTQNPMEVELEAIKNELAASSEELQKEKSENIKVKNERDALTTEKDALMNDKESLKMELSNKTSDINELMKEKETLLKEKDLKLNEFIGTKQNQEDLKKMMEQILKASKEHQMECNELIKLRAELVTANDELQMANDQREKEKEANTKVINKRDQLDKELTEANETIDQKLPKMEQLIEDFYMEVMDLKIERHHQRETSIGLRSKLLEANEQLAECKINERISC